LARRRFRADLHPVNSFKNIIDTDGGLVAGLASVTPVAIAVEVQNLVATSNNVPRGGHVRSFYYSLFVFADDTTGSVPPLIDVYWWKNVGGVSTRPTNGSTGSSDLKRFILHEEKGLSSSKELGGMPMIVKGVVKVPPSKSKFGLNDTIEMVLESANISGQFCAKHIYKVIY